MLSYRSKVRTKRIQDYTFLPPRMCITVLALLPQYDKLQTLSTYKINENKETLHVHDNAHDTS